MNAHSERTLTIEALKRGLLLSLLSLVFLTAGSCGERETRLNIFFTYDTSGKIELCGCSALQKGGMAKRKTLIEKYRLGPDDIVLDGGRINPLTDEFNDYKTEALIELMNRFPYQAANIGFSELYPGLAKFKEFARLAKFPFISANVFVKSDRPDVKSPELYQDEDKSIAEELEAQIIREFAPLGGSYKLLANPFVVFRRDGRSIAFVGITDRLPAVSPKGEKARLYLKTRDPKLIEPEFRNALPRLILPMVYKELKRHYDFVGVLIEGGEFLLDDLARNHGPFDLMLSGSYNGRIGARSVDKSEILNVWDRGQHLGIVRVVLRGKRKNLQVAVFDVSDDIKDDKELADYIQNRYKPGLKRFFGEGIKVIDDFIPAETCKSCHKPQHDHWSQSGHNRSLLVLAKGNNLYNPDCMRCHLTYDAKRDILQPVQCITCHSYINQKHIDSGGAFVDKETRVKSNIGYSISFCERCHDQENSSFFRRDFADYVRKLKH